jgi:hypothetical protein
VTAVKATRELTAPVEDYLKAIYELEVAGGPAGTNELAKRLAIAPASVSGMVRRLAEQGLISHERYRGVRLTEEGRLAALRTIRTGPRSPPARAPWTSGASPRSPTSKPGRKPSSSAWGTRMRNGSDTSPSWG